jgi:hypothetical protein
MLRIHSSRLWLENQEKVFASPRIAINIVSMLGALRRLLGFEVTIGELIITHSEQLQHMADVCMT